MIRNKVLLFAYRTVLVPLGLLFVILIGQWIVKKIREGLLMRGGPHRGRHPAHHFSPGQRPIWIHCSSGEFEYARPVIREIKKRFPEIPVLVTYFTPTYRTQIELATEVDLSCPLPLDLPGPCGAFLNYHQPRVLGLARTDTWPELLNQCRARNIPTVLFSKAQGPPNLRDKLLAWLTTWPVSLVDKILCVTKKDRQALLELGVSQDIEVMGDPRYDQVFFRLNEKKPIKDSLKPQNSALTLVAGSTWQEDERALIEATKDMVASGSLNLIIAPHEPVEAHIRSLKARIQRFGLTSLKYTEAEQWQTGQILIVDCVGVLAELYQWSDIALVGGSFKANVHSVMEPLACGNICLVGPHHCNNREALEFSEIAVGKNVKAVNVATTSDELKAHIEHFQSLSDIENIKQKIKAIIEKKTGASVEVANYLEQYIDL